MYLFTSILAFVLIFVDVIQGGVSLVACPVLGTPQLHYINRWELILKCNVIIYI